MNIAVMLARGVGERAGTPIPKQFILALRKLVIVHTLEAYERFDCIDAVEVATELKDGCWGNNFVYKEKHVTLNFPWTYPMKTLLWAYYKGDELSEKGAAILEGWFINQDSGAFSLDSFHNSLD